MRRQADCLAGRGWVPGDEEEAVRGGGRMEAGTVGAILYGEGVSLPETAVCDDRLDIAHQACTHGMGKPRGVSRPSSSPPDVSPHRLRRGTELNAVLGHTGHYLMPPCGEPERGFCHHTLRRSCGPLRSPAPLSDPSSFRQQAR